MVCCAAASPSHNVTDFESDRRWPGARQYTIPSRLTWLETHSIFALRISASSAGPRAGPPAERTVLVRVLFNLTRRQDPPAFYDWIYVSLQVCCGPGAPLAVTVTVTVQDTAWLLRVVTPAVLVLRWADSDGWPGPGSEFRGSQWHEIMSCPAAGGYQWCHGT